MAISVNKVTRMGMAGAMWQPQGSYSNKVAGTPATGRIMGSLAGYGGLAGRGGLAGIGGGLG